MVLNCQQTSKLSPKIVSKEEIKVKIATKIEYFDEVKYQKLKHVEKLKVKRRQIIVDMQI
jgi:hypothetical protein